MQHVQQDYEILGFIDNDINKHQQTLHGYVIYPVEPLPNRGDAIVLIASEFHEQIKQQLIDAGHFSLEQIKALPARLLTNKQFNGDSALISDALKTLSACCKQLAAMGVKHHVDAGTLLGLYRDGNLIPWDDDLDIAIDSSGVKRVSDSLELFVSSLNHVSGGDWQVQTLFSKGRFGAVPENAVRAYKFVDCSADPLPAIDFFVKYVANGFSDYCLSSRGIRMPAEYTASISEYICHDDIWPVPGDTPGYLTHHYGDWQVPDPNWSLQKLENTQVFE